MDWQNRSYTLRLTRYNNIPEEVSSEQPLRSFSLARGCWYANSSLTWHFCYQKSGFFPGFWLGFPETVWPIKNSKHIYIYIIAMLSEWLFTSVSNTKSSKCVIFYTIWLRRHFSMQWCNNEISRLCTIGGMHSYVYVKGLPLPVLRSFNEFDRYVIFYIIGQSYLQKQFHISCIGTTSCPDRMYLFSSL